MERALLLVVLVGAGCGHELDVDGRENLDRLPVPAERASLPRPEEAADAGAVDADEDDAADDEGGASADVDADVRDDGDDDGEDAPAADEAPPAPGPPPAEAGQACVEWTDCGPRFANPNSGFDCVDAVCTCNAEGNWDDACAGIGGVWSDEECFCFVSASPAPAEDADTWTADDEDDPATDRQCWWVWKETCEPDTWVDTSEYEWVCRSSDDCGYEYRPGGYWESGECDGYWIRRCDDGSEKRYGP
jgi:hypothetical protein